jgi:hypothetical protein
MMNEHSPITGHVMLQPKTPVYGWVLNPEFAQDPRWQRTKIKGKLRWRNGTEVAIRSDNGPKV